MNKKIETNPLVQIVPEKKFDTQAVEVKSVVQNQSAEKTIESNMNRSSSRFSGMAIILLLILFGVSIYKLYQAHSKSSDVVIATQIQQLKTIFDQIHLDCGIIGFEHEKNYIDFLTVESFVGSEIGSMNLLYPKEWKGPYVQDNPTVQEQQYIVLHNKFGYYIVPGDGIKLANGSVVGKDFILNYESDIEQAMLSDDKLKSESGILAVKLDFGQSTLSKLFSN